jgi:hypothetical protein
VRVQKAQSQLERQKARLDRLTAKATVTPNRAA